MKLNGNWLILIVLVLVLALTACGTDGAADEGEQREYEFRVEGVGTGGNAPPGYTFMLPEDYVATVKNETVTLRVDGEVETMISVVSFLNNGKGIDGVFDDFASSFESPSTTLSPRQDVEELNGLTGYSALMSATDNRTGNELEGKIVVISNDTYGFLIMAGSESSNWGDVQKAADIVINSLDAIPGNNSQST